MREIVIVTGCSGGIGYGVSQHLGNRGIETIGLDVHEIENPSCREFYKVNLAKKSEVDEVGRYLTKNNVRIKGIVNNAAVQLEKPFLDYTENDLSLIFDVNVKSIFYLMQAVDNLLIAGASIVNISSVHARATSKNISAYAASKGAVCALTRAMALEYGAREIRVNAILPGAIDTPMLRKGLTRNQSEREALEQLKNSSPLLKIGQSADIANLVEFLLCSKMSSNITGQEFVSDSGILSRLASE